MRCLWLVPGGLAYFFVMFSYLGHICQNAPLDISCGCGCLEYSTQYQIISLPPEIIQFKGNSVSGIFPLKQQGSESSDQVS